MPGISFLSWNLSLMERSDQAPATWRPDQSEARIRDFALARAPDLILFQELPGLVPFVETHDMAPANARGQSGDIATLVRRQMMADITATRCPFAVLTTLRGEEITIANVHLPSGKGAADDRLSAIRTIIDTSPTRKLAVIGDTNTRTAEEDAIADLGLIGARPPTATFNSRENRFRLGGREFTAYFTRAFHTADLTLTDQEVKTDPQGAGDSRFYLSDHFALFGRLAHA